MYFRGQPQITAELGKILPDLYENHGSATFLFRGPSGWGKTTIALMVCNYLSGGNFSYCLGNNLTFDEGMWVHFIDECHLIPNPEVLYPYIDSGKYVIIMATNDVSPLAEALSNRCNRYYFQRYSDSDLKIIASSVLKFELTDEMLGYIIYSGDFNPRIIKNLCKRLNTIMKHGGGSPKTMDEFRNLLSTYLGISNGLDTLSTRYIKTLRELGGLASLKTLATILHIDEVTLRNDVEPGLLDKKLIRISSKGRSVV